MKALKELFRFALLSLGLTTVANADMISGGPFDGTDVGDIDIYIDEISNMGSGEQTEVDWVNSVLGTSFTTGDLYTEGPVTWYETDTIDVIAFALQTGPGYYLIKNARLHVLFENVTNFDWGVINLANIVGDINLGDDFIISHVSEFGGTTPTPVTEPGTLALLGIGFASLGLARRRRQV